MSKRQAATYLTKEPSRRPNEDEENERDKVDPVQIASAEVMATRKLAKPRRNRFANPGAAPEQNNGINGAALGTKPPVPSSGGLFGSIKTTTPSLPTSTFSFGSSSSSNPFAKIAPTSTSKPSIPPPSTSTTTTNATTTPINPFASLKASEPKSFAGLKSLNEQKSLFPPNSPFAKHPPATTPTPSSFTRDMASQQFTPASQPQRTSGAIRTPRQPLHAPAAAAATASTSFQTPQPPARAPVQSHKPSQSISTPTQRSLMQSGDNVPIPTPERNPSDPPEKHYWQRIKAMNAAFSEAVQKSIEGDAYCNLEWLFGQYKYWRDEIEKGYPYEPTVDSPGVSQRTRVDELKSGLIMKPPTPSKVGIPPPATSSSVGFVRSQAPPPETQPAVWEVASTQSTERTRSFGASQGSKTAETILGVLDSPAQGKIGYQETMKSVKKHTERDLGMFKFETTEAEKKRDFGASERSMGATAAVRSGFGGSGGFSFGTGKPGHSTTSTTSTFSFGAKPVETTSKPEPTATKSLFGTSSMKPFSFNQSSSFPAKQAPTPSQPSSSLMSSKPSTLGQGSSFPTTTSTPSKSFGTSFTSTSTFSFTARKQETKRASPPKPVEPPAPVIVQPPSNRFAALSAPAEKEVINLDSDEEEEMVQDKSEQDEEMAEEEEEEAEDESMDDEAEEEEEDVEVEEEAMDDDVKDTDYVVLDEDEEAEEEEPQVEEVAKEAKELVESTPEKTVPTFKFLASGGPLFGAAQAGAPTKFSLGFSAPAGNTPFKFGVSQPSKAEEQKTEEVKPTVSEEPKETPKESTTAKSAEPSSPAPAPPSPRRLRSASPAKHTHQDQPASPTKRKRGTSLQKPTESEETLASAPAESAPVEIGEPLKPFVFGVKTTSTPTSAAAETAEQPIPEPFLFGSTATTTTPKDSREQPKTFTFGSTTTTTKDSTATEPPKPFSFSAPVKKDFTWTPDKPIKFDTPPSSTVAKPAANPFGSSSMPFQIGGISTPAPPAAPPKFGSFGGSPSAFGAFGGSNVSFTSPSLGFSFGQPKAESKQDEKEEKAEAEEGEEETPIVSEEVGNAGEEDEENIFSERAKLILRLSPAEKAKEVEKRVAAGGKAEDVKNDRDYGVGVVRVNVNKESKKCRILFRLEGSGRVVLNSYLLPGVTYQKQGKSMVLVPALRSDGQGLDSYFVRVKEAVVAENLARILEEKKNIA